MDGLATVPHDGIIENLTYAEITPGRSASLSRTLTREAIEMFAAASGNLNPALLDEAYAQRSPLHGIAGHGLWTGSLVSAVLGTLLPGPGTVTLRQDLHFVRPVRPGDVITATVTARELRGGRGVVLFDCVCTNQDGTAVLAGIAEVIAPRDKIRCARPLLPETRQVRHDGLRPFLTAAQGGRPLATAVVHPCDADSLLGALKAAEAGLIDPILIGPRGKIHSVAESVGADVSDVRVIDVEHSHAAAERAVAMALAGEAAAVMKGALHTDELMHAVTRREGGLRTDRRISHAFVIAAPSYHKPLIVTDAAINIQPTLEDKADILKNAIALAHALGIALPKVAILSAVETVTAKIPTTLEAAVLCKMAERSQITGALLDGPLAYDNAISAAAARTKGIVSEVAGDPDILLAPNLEAGNMIAKQLTFMADADAAGIVLGARVPVILTSRADGVACRMASCAMAALLARAEGHRR